MAVSSTGAPSRVGFSRRRSSLARLERWYRGCARRDGDEMNRADLTATPEYIRSERTEWSAGRVSTLGRL